MLWRRWGEPGAAAGTWRAAESGPRPPIARPICDPVASLAAALMPASSGRTSKPALVAISSRSGRRLEIAAWRAGKSAVSPPGCCTDIPPPRRAWRFAAAGGPPPLFNNQCAPGLERLTRAVEVDAELRGWGPGRDDILQPDLSALPRLFRREHALLDAALLAQKLALRRTELRGRACAELWRGRGRLLSQTRIRYGLRPQGTGNT